MSSANSPSDEQTLAGPNQVLVIGASERSDRDAIAFAAARASAQVEFLSNTAEAQAWMSDPAHHPGCILLCSKTDREGLSRWVRDRARFFSVPIIALVPHPSDAAFRGAYSEGADDALLHGDLGGITRRLANLSNRPADIRPPANQGLAVIGFPDIPRRRVLGRTLRQAGFDVSFAVNADELAALAHGAEPPTLIVTHPNFPPNGGSQAIAGIRAILGRERLPALMLPATADEEHSAQVDTDSEQAGKLLFFAEEAMRADVRDMRASARLLHFGLCAFREAGSLNPIYGLTHNVSRQGLYVRTLDPPRPGSSLWFEMRAPELGTAIHLRGKVVWRREPSQMGGAAPPGFGLRIEAEECPKGDLERYEQGYDELAVTQSHEVELPPAANHG